MTNDTIERERTVTLDRHNGEGDVIDTVELDTTIFGVVPNIPLMHQVVTAQLAARRSGTHSTKTRSEVSGGGAKPYRQKGTGRARQGTVRAPQFAGGGVAFGPKPRSYAQRTPRKMVRLALCSALSDRLNEGRLRLVDSWPFEVPKTKDAVKLLQALDVEGRILVVLASEDALAERSFGNLPHVHLVEAAQLSAYEVLANDWVVFTTGTIPGGVTVVEGSAAKAKAATAKARKKAAAEAEAESAAAEAEAEVAEAEAAEAAASASDADVSDADESETDESETDSAVELADVEAGEADDDSSDDDSATGAADVDEDDDDTATADEDEEDE
ncbi:MAG: 50S ribosomal protein L4 [Acidimicrobiales bacterium]|jgi:large subunit ribosomal protein L4